MLPAGARLEVLERDAGEGYSRVRTDQGTEGFVLSRYLMDEPAAREQLADARRRLEQALAQRGSAGEMLDAVTRERDALIVERDGLTRQVSTLESELAAVREAAAEPLRMRERALDLEQQVAALEEQVSTLTLETRVLTRSAQRDWFLAGAGVLIAGLVLGLVLPRIRWRRRSRWSDL
jgi:SH3 domain protein